MLNFRKRKIKTKWGSVTYYNSYDRISFRFATYTYDDEPDILYFSNLEVDDSCRKQGIGDSILNFVIVYAKENQYSSIILNVVKGSWVKRWYESKGFETLEDKDDKYVWMKMTM